MTPTETVTEEDYSKIPARVRVTLEGLLEVRKILREIGYEELASKMMDEWVKLVLEFAPKGP